ncbi:conserved Plasmodium membrane protein, unknown function [Plasmodium ovale curtisi]|uniref:Uncharacterized protein n=1 Tax=Plasmodium ovale curtisi TaxID=864141 RepID=A0A1A8W472_PLAOA|nr:conserved Plasmodium membrane protein, unknown function [Plasmodium ovale curtisi]
MENATGTPAPITRISHPFFDGMRCPGRRFLLGHVHGNDNREKKREEGEREERNMKSYGIACLPLSFLQQKNIEYDKREIENRFTNLKEKEMMIKNKYNKYNEMREKDKYEILKIEKMKRILSKYNYKLQEMEKLSESWLSYIIGIGLTFRVVAGLVFLTFSFVIYISLLAAITDKYYNSICAYKCGFVLEQISTIFNLLDSMLILFSQFSHIYFLLLLVRNYKYGHTHFFYPIVQIEAEKVFPGDFISSLLFDYPHNFGLNNDFTDERHPYVHSIEKYKITVTCDHDLFLFQLSIHSYCKKDENTDSRIFSDNIGYIKCSLKTDKNVCIPYFANSYFFSNCLFIRTAKKMRIQIREFSVSIFLLMYTFSLVYRIFFKKFSYLDSIDELDLNKENLDEHMNLLPLETLT